MTYSWCGATGEDGPDGTASPGFRESLEANGLLPGLLDGIRYVSRVGNQHNRYGVFLLDRLINEAALADFAAEEAVGASN